MLPFRYQLKLRAGWGVSANAGIAPYTTLGSLGNNFYNFGQEELSACNLPKRLPDKYSAEPQPHWEKTSGLNIGVDFGLFDNRLSAQ
jgi:hypothetical protein